MRPKTSVPFVLNMELFSSPSEKASLMPLPSILRKRLSFTKIMLHRSMASALALTHFLSMVCNPRHIPYVMPAQCPFQTHLPLLLSTLHDPMGDCAPSLVNLIRKRWRYKISTALPYTCLIPDPSGAIEPQPVLECSRLTGAAETPQPFSPTFLIWVDGCSP